MQLADDVRLAIAAALGAGVTQVQIAAQYKVSRTTVARIKAEGQKVASPANPLSEDWRNEHAKLYVNAITEKMSKIEDPAKAVNAAQVGLTKLGLLGGDNPGQTKIEVWLGSDAVAKIAAKWTTTASGELPDNGATEAKLLNP